MQITKNILIKKEKMKTNFEKAKILIDTLVAANLYSCPHYEIFKDTFSQVINDELKNFEISLQIGDNKTCYYLSKIYELGIGGQQDKYIADLFIVIGKELEDEKCSKIFASNPAKYVWYEPAASKFITGYIGKSSNIPFEDAIISAHQPPGYNELFDSNSNEFIQPLGAIASYETNF
ncbi:hypothetical protein [Rickettsia endosymbiont of Halotydeus destructor]|uniref:hypothetical protein n=1 Tax=Rickettsia endosymbiont of Halotydeus destructor TaxID=2996754 RepID=UPI003BAE8ED3